MRGRHWAVRLMVAAACAGPAIGAAASPSDGRDVSVIVQGQTGAERLVMADVHQVGGRVIRALPIVAGVLARVPEDSIAGLRDAPGVRVVTADTRVHLESINPTFGYDITNDEGSTYFIAHLTHATDAWSSHWTGQGVDVALIDSGVSPVQGLTSGNVVNGPDLSFESQNPSLAHLDTYGHGTFMASLIAGRDTPASGGTYANAGSEFTGMAPDARLISIKVASADGAADVSQVLAAINWVVQHAHDPGFNIRVLNLSFGTNSTQDPSVDPLDYAVDNAWRAGIVVVVSAGNEGTSRPTLTDPANDPLVLAVGADDQNNSNNPANGGFASFSSVGTVTRHVDLISPGVHVIGLRDPQGYVDQHYPSAEVGSRFFRGSGTSQAAAIVSGLVALYLQRWPSATPDQVKTALLANVTVPTNLKTSYPTVGVPDINKSIGLAPPSTAAAQQAASGATGTGSLEAARGGSHVAMSGVELTGEQDIFGHAWNGSAWAAATAQGQAWTGGTWNGNAWTGQAWTGQSWTSTTWAGQAWTGQAWTGQAWTGQSWTSHSWTSAGWDGQAWTDSCWDGADWSSDTWATASWS